MEPKLMNQTFYIKGMGHTHRHSFIPADHEQNQAEFFLGLLLQFHRNSLCGFGDAE